MRPAEKGPSLFKVIYLSVSTHGSSCPVLDFFQEAGCHQVAQLHVQVLLLSQYLSPMPGSQLLDLSEHCILLQHVLSQTLPHTSLALPLSSYMSLGELQSFLPRVKLPKPKPAESQALVPPTADPKKAKAAFKASPGHTCGDF